jgi:hypothetical protein
MVAYPFREREHGMPAASVVCCAPEDPETEDAAIGAATNGENDPLPETDLGGPALEFDLPSFRVGVAEYEDGPTGCTVFEFPGSAATAIDVRGGPVGKIGDYGWNHAICLAGGSLPGLEAAAGVSAELWERRGRSLDGLPLVSGAIIFDYGGRENRIRPDMALGRAALSAAREGIFPLGARGRRGASPGVGVSWAISVRSPPARAASCARPARQRSPSSAWSTPSGSWWDATDGSCAATGIPRRASIPQRAYAADSEPGSPPTRAGGSRPSPW